MPKFNVTVHGCIWVKSVVTAPTAADARREAMYAADIYDADHSWDDVDIEEIKPKPRKKRSDPKQMKLDVE